VNVYISNHDDYHLIYTRFFKSIKFFVITLYWFYVGVFGQHTMRYSIDTWTDTQHVISGHIKNALSQPCLVYSLTNTCTNTQSPLLISKFYQALLSGIFLSVKAYSFLNLTLSSMLILDLPLLSYFSFVILTLTILTMHLTLIFTY
jgi:hypothetical protein